MAFRVKMTASARRDLAALHEYVSQHDSPEKAEYVLDRIELAIKSFAESPHRGTYPKELLASGARAYREIFFKPYRLIYRVSGRFVYIELIAEGRRDMQTLLQRRLLGE